MSNTKLALVRARYIANKSPYTQHRSYKPVKRLLHYIAFGSHAYQTELAPPQRGSWLDHNETAHSHTDVLQWAKQKVHRFDYDYAYQLLLSTRHGHLTATDFAQSVAQGTDVSGVYEWRLMVHTDTANQHAHAVLFRKARLQKELYKQWQQAMQQRLEQTQLARWEEIQLTQAQSQNQEWEQTL